MHSIIKWPGGKTREIDKIKYLIPQNFARYVEPFFGGGALYFHLMPKSAAINDISASLISFYRLVKAQDQKLRNLLIGYNDSFQNLISVCDKNASALIGIFEELYNDRISKEDLIHAVSQFLSGVEGDILSGFRQALILNTDEFVELLRKMAVDKFIRTVSHYRKKPFSAKDLRENLITGFASGYYMYFRKVYNDISLGRIYDCGEAYAAANYYFIREYCYGSMFRYNAKGEFNIPYGGMSYNRKDMKSKIELMFNQNVEQLFNGTEIHCSDFEVFFDNLQLSKEDFIFLDPPYDTDFSDYEGKAFTKNDQERLANALKRTEAKFIMVIKNTDFIYGLYEKNFNILSFDKQYTYNVRSRNDRDVEHLIITNLPVF